ncbi:MAG: hypothetical protein QXV32_07330 [Conexivisphaerales archaeon]
MKDKSYFALPFLPLPLIFSNGEGVSIILLSLAYMLFLLGIRVKRSVKEEDTVEAMMSGILDWTVAIMTRSRHRVLLERYLLLKKKEDELSLSNLLRGLPVKGEDRMYMKGSAPSGQEIALSASEQRRRFLSSYRASIETRLSLLQAISFFVPIMLLIFAERDFTDIAGQFYLALDYSLCLWLARMILVKRI